MLDHRKCPPVQRWMSWVLLEYVFFKECLVLSLFLDFCLTVWFLLLTCVDTVMSTSTLHCNWRKIPHQIQDPSSLPSLFFPPTHFPFPPSLLPSTPLPLLFFCSSSSSFFFCLLRKNWLPSLDWDFEFGILMLQTIKFWEYRLVAPHLYLNLFSILSYFQKVLRYFDTKLENKFGYCIYTTWEI